MTDARITKTDSRNAGADASNTATTGAARRRRLGRALTLVAAVALPLLVWVIAVPLAGLELVVGASGPAGPAGATPMLVTPVAIVMTALFAGLAAWGAIALLERITRHGRLIFTVIGWTLLALSLVGPAGAGASGGVLLTLIAMHLVTGAALMIGLPLAATRATRAARATHE